MRANTTSDSVLRLVKSQGTNSDTPINETVQILLNGYEQPAVLSDARDGHIVFFNDAARQKIGLSYSRHGDKTLEDLFNGHSMVDENPIWERRKNKYEVREEELEIGGQKYIHSVIKPLAEPDLADLQQEMAKLLVHRFHSPLNGVTGFTELLKDLSLTDKQERYINSIESGLDDFKEVLANISDLAHDVDVCLNTIDPHELKSKVLALYSSAERQKIDVAIDPEVTSLYSDPILLKAMIKELLDNALKFGDNEHPRITLHFRQDHTIRVTNNGNPISEAQTQKIFYPFFSSKARGIGLGLAKCDYYGQALGYTLSLTSNSRQKGISFDIQMR